MKGHAEGCHSEGCASTGMQDTALGQGARQTFTELPSRCETHSAGGHLGPQVRGTQSPPNTVPLWEESALWGCQEIADRQTEAVLSDGG